MAYAERQRVLGRRFAPAVTDVVRLDADEQSKDRCSFRAERPSTLAYDAKAGELTGVNDGEVVVAPGADLKTARRACTAGSPTSSCRARKARPSIRPPVSVRARRAAVTSCESRPRPGT